MNDFFNKKVGGFGLGLVIISAYIGFKFKITGLNDVFLWYTIWFIAIVFSALAADLFQKNDDWIYNSLKNIETMNISSEEKMKLFRFQLSQAVSRWYTVFMQVNGFSSTFKKLLANTGKIFKGIISIKELLILVLWAMYDLVLRGGILSFTNPFDILFLFTGLVGLKIVDASKGFPSLVADMYKESMEERDSSLGLTIMEAFIVQLGYLFAAEQEKTPETEFKIAVDKLNELIPKIDPEKLNKD